MSETTHLALPYLAAAQAQKHVTHNEALSRLDVVVQLGVLDAAMTAPPDTPEEGDRYIVAAGASDAWEGHDGEVAAFVDGVWTFAVPGSGWVAFDAASESVLVYAGGSWVAIGSFLGAVARFGVNTAADDTNRLAVRSEAALFKAIDDADGGSGDVRITLSKEMESDTASLILQDGFSGRAEIGLAGDDDLVFKVSDDGAGWIEAIRIDNASGVPAVLYDNGASGLSATSLHGAIDELASEKLSLGGGTMSGALVLAADPGGSMEAATKHYVDQISVAGDAMIFKGVIDCSANPNYPAANLGDTYRVSVAGRIGGGSGITVEIGDILICLTNGTASGNQATVGSEWSVIQANLDGAVIGPASATDGHLAQFDGTTGKLIKGGKAAPSGTVVGSSDAQTLTNKTISTANNTITSASTSVKGIVELATDAEARAGTDTARAVTPAAMRAATREQLSANRTYYVRTNGSDSNDGLSNTSGGAFLTIQHAVDVALGLDFGIYDVVIQIADGAYTSGAAIGPHVGSGSLTIQGNATTPANVTVTTAGNCFQLSDGAIADIQDMKLSAPTSGWCLYAESGSTLRFANINFGSAATGHMAAINSATIWAVGNYAISGGAAYHCWAETLSTIRMTSLTVTITGTPAFSGAFVNCTRLAVALLFLNTYSGSATGVRYSVQTNSLVQVAGGGASYLPGDSSGSASSGGIYA